jgi:undecaprenyl-diphosphatase
MVNWDYQIFTYVNGFAGSNRILDETMIFIARWGIFLYLLLLAWLCTKKEKRTDRRLKLIVRTGLAAVAALAINMLVGMVYFRPRPFVLHQVNLLVGSSPDDASFPSDHTAFAAAFTAALFDKDRGLAVFLAVFTVVLGISRVYVGVHYPFDVLGGICTGILGNGLVSLSWPRIDCLINRVAAPVLRR